MSLPETRGQMLRARYVKLSTVACKRCGSLIEWWQTTNGKRVPFDLGNGSVDEIAKIHRMSCEAKLQAGDIAAELNALRDRYGARVIVLLTDEGSHAAWRNCLPAEDIAHELITEANRLRRELQSKDL